MRPAWRLAAALAVVGVLVLPRAAIAAATAGSTAERMGDPTNDGHASQSSRVPA